MSDELQIQQGSNSTPYALTGGVIGGLGAGYGAHHLTKPKYNSYEDIIAESKDSFDKKLEAANGEEKDLLTRAKEIREAGAKYDADLEAFKADPANANVLKETPEYKKLVEEQQAAEKKYADKKAELEKIGTTDKPGEASPRARQALDAVNKEIDAETKRLADFEKVFKKDLKAAVDNLYEKVNEVDRLEEEVNAAIRDKKPAAEIDALKAQLKTARAEAKVAEAELETMANNTAETLIEAKGKKSEVAEKRAAKAKEIKTTALDIVAERTHNESTIRSNVRELQAKKVQAFKDIKSVIGTDLSKADAAEAERQVGRHIKVEEAKLEKLEKFKKLFTEAENKVKISGGETSLVEEISKLLGIFKKTKTSTTVKTAGNVFAESLTKEEAETFERLVKGGADAEAIDKAIKQQQERINKLNTSIANIKATNAQFEELGGKGAYYKKGALRTADGKVVKFKPVQIKLANDVEIPASSKLTALQKQKAAIEENINGVAGKKLTEKEIEEKLANEIAEVNKKKAAVEEAKKGLEVGEAKTPEQIAKEFTEKNGSKEDYIKKVTEKNKDELKKLFERKHGFNNWKLAGVAAAGALVVGAIASAFAPKSRG